MPKVPQSSFTSGEITPTLHRRPDLARYLTGLKTCRNFFVHPEGGASNRPGTQFVCEVKISTKATRVIEFQFNTEQTYVIEVGDQYMRFIKDAGQIVLPSTPAAWVTSTAYEVADHVSNSGVNYYCHTAHTSAAADEPGVGVNWTDYWYALTTDIVEIPTPYLEAELFDLQFVQSADIITIVHPNHPPTELGRLDHHQWFLSDISFIPTIQPPTGVSGSGGAGTSYDYVVTSISEETGEESLASSPAASMLEDGGTLTWTAAAGAEFYAIYKEKNGVFGFIGTADGLSFLDEKIIPELDDTPPRQRNPFDAVNKYPATCMYHEQRLCFAQTIEKPQTIWMSQTGNFHNFNISSPLKADDAITLRIDAAQVNEVRHLVSLTDLLVMTSGAEHKITSGDNAFAFENLRARPQSYRGSIGLRPIVIGNTVIFVQARGSHVRDMEYSLEADGYTGKSLSVLSNHLFKEFTLVDWCYAQELDSIIWSVRNDGTLLGLTYMKEHEVLAWHRHDTDGLFESVCSIPECVCQGQEDAVYFVVQRTINGSTKRYIERMHTRRFQSIEEAFFVDSGLTYTGPTGTITAATKADPVVITDVAHPYVNGDRIRITDVVGMIELNNEIYTVANKTTDTYELSGIDGTAFTTYVSGGVSQKVVDTLSGLTHLEGKTVAILADGNVHPQEVVSSGAISLDYEAAIVNVGLPYVADLGTLEPPIEGTLSNPKNAQMLTLGVLYSRGLWAGPDENDLDELKQREDEAWADPIALKTGYFELPIQGDWENYGSILIRQVDPLPLTVLSIIPDYDVGS